MLDTALWLSFEEGLTEKDVQDVERRLGFLKDVLEMEIAYYPVHDVRSDLDLDLHIYLEYFTIIKNENLSAWLIHDGWLHYHNDGAGLSHRLRKRLTPFYRQSLDDLYACLEDFLACVNSHDLIAGEADAVIWLSLLDYLAARLLEKIQRDRLQVIFGAQGS